MKKMRKLMALTLAVLMVVAALSGCGSKKEFPSDTITIYVHAAAGGGTDTMCRQVASLISEAEGWNVACEQKTGGSGAVMFNFVSGEDADGYTLGSGPCDLAILDALGTINLEDNTMLACTIYWPAALYVAADAPYDTLDDFVEYCAANPGEVKLGNSGSGGIWHICAANFAQKAGIEVTHVPYDGAATALAGALNGEIDGCIVGTTEGYSYVESGDFKCLGVFDGEESVVLPGVPTAASQGYDMNFGAWVGLCAPKDLDEEVRVKLVDAIEKAVASDEYIEFCESRGFMPKFMNTEDFTAFAKAEAENNKALLTELGMI